MKIIMIFSIIYTLYLSMHKFLGMDMQALILMGVCYLIAIKISEKK